MTDQQGRYTRQADALQAKIERCKTGQKGEMQDRPKERDTGHAKSERCSTGQKRELQDRPKWEMHYSPNVLTLQAVQYCLSLPLLYLPPSCRHTSPVSILYTLCTSPPIWGSVFSPCFRICTCPVRWGRIVLGRHRQYNLNSDCDRIWRGLHFSPCCRIWTYPVLKDLYFSLCFRICA